MKPCLVGRSLLSLNLNNNFHSSWTRRKHFKFSTSLSDYSSIFHLRFREIMLIKARTSLWICHGGQINMVGKSLFSDNKSTKETFQLKFFENGKETRPITYAHNINKIFVFLILFLLYFSITTDHPLTPSPPAFTRLLSMFTSLFPQSLHLLPPPRAVSLLSACLSLFCLLVQNVR